MRTNYQLKDEIQAYWSARATTFDQSASHGIRTQLEQTAWRSLMRSLLGAAAGGQVLELASGTGEVTRLLADMGCNVTGLDIAEPMVSRARAKLADHPNARIFLGDAEDTRAPTGAYDALVCRNLVWTLVDPHSAVADWHRVLKPGGRLVIIDGDWVNIPLGGRLRALLARIVAWLPGQTSEPKIDWDSNNSIQRRVYFSTGLTLERLLPILTKGGFALATSTDLKAVHKAQRKGEAILHRFAQRLRTGMYSEFAIALDRQ